MDIDPKNRRRHYFIDSSFQTKFIMKFCLLIACTSLLAGGLIYWFNRATTTVAFENLRVVVKSTSDFILPIMIEILAIVTVLVGFATIAVTLFASHKIAGPLYRFKSGIDKVRAGDLASRFSIRTGDQLQKVANEFEHMRIELKDSIVTLKDNWTAIKAKMLGQMAAKDTEEKTQILDTIKKIDSELGRFKTD